MRRVAANVEYLDSETIPLQFAEGRCLLAITSGLFELPLPSRCYVVLASWFDASSPVAMFVNVIVGAANRGVHVVSAHPEFRGPRSEEHQVTLPVEIGTWLFATGRLTHHSPDRTDAGDRWARAVGGILPERDQRGTEDEAALSGKLGLARLNEIAWPEAVLTWLAG